MLRLQGCAGVIMACTRSTFTTVSGIEKLVQEIIDNYCRLRKNWFNRLLKTTVDYLIYFISSLTLKSLHEQTTCTKFIDITYHTLN